MEEVSFGTGGWRAPLEEFSDERVRMVGQAVSTYLRDTQGKSARPVAVGYDARRRSRDAAESLADVLAANGFDVLLTDRDLPTPVVAHAIADRDLAGALIVTASHNPPDYNGIKFVPEDTASPLPSVTDAIESRLAPPAAPSEVQRGSITEFDPVPAHRERAVGLTEKYFNADLSGLTIVYDAMHGSGRDVTDDLLDSCGAEVIRRRCERDPSFGGTAPEPNPETLENLPKAVRRADADLGIANDGDGDRITVCTPERGILNGHLLFAGLYRALLTDGGASGPVVRTVSTTFLIDRIATANDAEVYEVPVGFKWIAQGMFENDALFGGEESGGFTIRDHIGEKDGVLVALLAAAVTAGEPFDARLDQIFAHHGHIYADKTSVDCPNAQKETVISTLESNIPETVAGVSVAETVSIDGFKLLLEDGSWTLIRASGTEPKLRVYAEASDEDRLASLLDAGRDLVEPLVESPASE